MHTSLLGEVSWTGSVPERPTQTHTDSTETGHRPEPSCEAQSFLNHCAHQTTVFLVQANMFIAQHC